MLILFYGNSSKFVLLGMLSIVLLGTGNVAQHLFEGLRNLAPTNLLQVYGRNENGLAYFQGQCDTTAKIENIKDADIYILAVSDRAIPTLAQELEPKKGMVVHTSGSVPMEAIPSARRGVFYPLQSFTKGKSLSFKGIPLCLEAAEANDKLLLEGLAQQLSQKVVWISSEQRKKLHLSAVIVNNFANHCYQLAQDICNTEGLPFNLLHPLIQETAEKIEFLSPEAAQTGPARRNDVQTMQEHLALLEDPIHKKIYQLFSESIKSYYEEKL